MPIPIPAPVPASEANVVPQAYYVRETQDWAIAQERQRHNQALLSVGEYAMFALMWHIQDYEAGLVEHCTRCYGTVRGANQDLIAGVYKQATQARCPDCYGTTYEGGYKALIVRPSIFSDTDEGETMDARGVVHQSDLNVETTIGFRVRSGDFVFRANGDRYRLRVPERITLRTGFALPNQSGHAIGYNNARAGLEDPNTSVAYDIGPSGPALRNILTQATHVPYDFSAVEVIRGPLIPAND